jgi:MATE family multidrug resistance protein
LTLASYLIDGAAFAAESLTGVSLGAGDRVALRRVYRLSMIGGEGFAALFLVALFAARDPVLRLLTSHDDLVRSAVSYAPWLIPVVGIGAAAYMYDGIFLGLTEGRRLRNSMILSTVGVFIPIAIAAVALHSNHVLWAALAAFMAARVVTLAIASRRIIPAVA